MLILKGLAGGIVWLAFGYIAMIPYSWFAGGFTRQMEMVVATIALPVPLLILVPSVASHGPLDSQIKKAGALGMIFGVVAPVIINILWVSGMMSEQFWLHRHRFEFAIFVWIVATLVFLGALRAIDD